MRFRVPIAGSLLRLIALIAALACTSTKVTDREKYQGKRLARPDRIIVHDFAVAAAELPAWSEARDRVAAPSKPRTREEVATGRQLGSGGVDSGGGGKSPGVVVPLIVRVATANPIGLAVGGAVKAQGELSGRTTIEGTARRTADAIAEEQRAAFEKQGWI